MMGGQGQLALNQLLVVMDGIDNPPFMRRFLTNRVNSFLDAVYVIPRRLGRVSLRLPRPRPLSAQIYFIGATNVPIEVLDPALTRPGRMGRHVWFRTPTKEDRKDIFDLYLDKVSHDPDLDTPERRDEIARITNGYSPAMIEQICSMALTNAHHEGRLVVHVAAPRRRDDRRRVGNRDRRQLHRGGIALGRDPRGRPCSGGARVPARDRVEPALDPDARRLARPSSDLRPRGAVQPLAERGRRRSDPHRRRDGGGARVLRRELARRRRRPRLRDAARRGHGRDLGHGARRPRSRPAASSPTRARRRRATASASGSSRSAFG